MNTSSLSCITPPPDHPRRSMWTKDYPLGWVHTQARQQQHSFKQVVGSVGSQVHSLTTQLQTQRVTGIHKPLMELSHHMWPANTDSISWDLRGGWETKCLLLPNSLPHTGGLSQNGRRSKHLSSDEFRSALRPNSLPPINATCSQCTYIHSVFQYKLA